ncbi:MAG: DUF6756 family protein [Polyangiaceae bacterium]
MDRELEKSIEDHAIGCSNLRLLTRDESETLRVDVLKRFGLPEGRRWLWEGIGDRGIHELYSGEEVFSRLAQAIPEGNDDLYLFVTDDERPPWLCVSGSKGALLQMLKEQRCFEYFVTNAHMSWLLFDTLHNALFMLKQPLLQRLDEADLIEIQKRCDSATGGPWTAFVEGRDHVAGSSFIRTAGEDIEMSGASEEDYDFIAAARQDIPGLIAEVRALRLELRGRH